MMSYDAKFFVNYKNIKKNSESFKNLEFDQVKSC